MNIDGWTLSGISDEAGKSLAKQIEAHKKLGWEYVELRTVDGQQFTDLTDEAFDAACAQLSAADMKVSGFASGIANWATKISDPFENSVTTLRRVIPRMQKLGTKFIRVMSYPNNGLSDEAWGAESIKRMKELGKIAADGGITILVENCDGWASVSADHYATYFERIASPAVRAVYDTGNPCSHGKDNTWEWYQKARPHIGYVHIKAHTSPVAGEKGKHTWPDIGTSCVKETLLDLKKTGYTGFVSIEPHLEAIAHEGKQITQEEAAFHTYVEYGQRLMALMKSIS